MKRQRPSRTVVVVAALICVSAFPAAQAPPRPLTVSGDVGTALSLTLDDLDALPRTGVEVEDEG